MVVDLRAAVASVDSDLVAIAQDALLTTDRNGKILFVNPAAESLLNAPSRLLTHRLLVSHVEPAHRRAFRVYLARAVNGEPLRFSFDLTPRGMQPFPVQARVVPFGEDLGWVLREEPAQPLAPGASGTGPSDVEFGSVLEAVRDGVVVVGRDRAIQFANRAAQAMFAPHELAVGEPLPAPLEPAISRLVAELLEHDAFNAEAIVEPDPRTAWWARAYKSGSGDAVLLLSDVTAEERREQAERDFVANAAHELQSPLTGISGAVEVLLSGAHRDEAERLRFLEHIAHENERLSRLLRSLLLLAQAQAADVEVELERFVLLPLLESIAETEWGIDVVCRPTLAVLAERELVEHALRNLVANARRHGGGDRIVIAALRDKRGSVRVDVSDFGPGIAAEDRARVFERFYRGRGTVVEGFGLGLAIAQQAARAVGGELGLRPSPRGGTTVSLTLRSGSE